jgi:hypothetical protein
MHGGSPSDQQPLAIPAIASAGAAVLHATAAGIHADHPTLSRIFVALAVAQAAVAIFGLLRGGRFPALALAGVNTVAVGGWVATRLTGISWVSGLEVAERPQPADTIAAVLAAIAVVGSLAAIASATPHVPRRAVGNAALLAGVLVVPGLVNATNHDHTADHGDTAVTVDGHDHTAADTADDTAAGTDSAAPVDDGHDHAANDPVTSSEASADDGHDHATDATTDVATGAATDGAHDHATEADPASVWPRPWDPAGAIDFSGVAGVSAEQQGRAEQLVVDTLRDLPAFADVTTLERLGYRSIGDAATGFEHFINPATFVDDKFLDPTAPESLVYQVDGADRTLVSAMFIAASTPIDDPKLLDYAGPLMQWHVHTDLCWKLDANGKPQVAAVLADLGDTCPAGSFNTGGDNPMVHVWIAPHQCGPFAALEGVGAGQASVPNAQRVDQCGEGHDHTATEPDVTEPDATEPDVTTTPYDPTLPIDLGGVDGVSLQQQAFAENLVAATVRDLPQWSDVAVAEAAGFRSIGDGALGHEHYLQWDWIDDDVWLDPDFPESLVYEPQPDGSKKLVSAMFMLPTDYPLEDIPDWGGPLMQWHVHGDLCFTPDHDAPQVAGLKPVGGTCRPPLVDFPLSPMIHVWITPTECGPFAALDGVAGGQVPEGETVLCDDAHGSH